jgi:hypothetical protein
MPSDLKEKKRTTNVDALWARVGDAVAFLIEATFDILIMVLMIIKTPMYVYNTLNISINPYESSLASFHWPSISCSYACPIPRHTLQPQLYLP